MVDFIDEVNDDLRHERMERLWKRVGSYMLVASIIIVVVAAASMGWQSYQRNRQLQAAKAYLGAEEAARDEAAKAFDALIAGNAKGFPQLAQFKTAKAYLDAGKLEEAEAHYVALANTGNTEPGLRAIARIYASQLMMTRNAPLDEVSNMLEQLAENTDSPFASIAKERLAYAALQAGETEQAKSLFSELAEDETAPTSLKQRVAAHLSALPAGE
ncbi:MAG: tetratricopeptide repeat protein [Rickettsiales bacterium]